MAARSSKIRWSRLQSQPGQSRIRTDLWGGTATPQIQRKSDSGTAHSGQTAQLRNRNSLDNRLAGQQAQLQRPCPPSSRKMEMDGMRIHWDDSDSDGSHQGFPHSL